MILRNGLISGKPALLTNTATATITAAQMNHQTHVLTAACDLTLPTATVGLDGIFYANSDFEFAVVPGTADYCILNGTTLKIAQGVVSDGKAFSCVRARCLVAGYWTMTTLRGTISANSIYTSTTESPLISSVALGAFLDNLSAGAMAVIAAYPLLQVDVYYGQTLLRGYTGSAAVGTGRTMEELLVNGDFSSAVGWTLGSGWAIGSNVLTGTACSSDASRLVATSAGMLHRTTFTINSTNGQGVDVMVGGTADGINRTTTGTFTEYMTDTPGTTGAFYIRARGVFTGEIDNASDMKVTAPTTSGCLLYNSRAMTTQSLLVNTFVAGSYNRSAYTVILSKPR